MKIKPKHLKCTTCGRFCRNISRKAKRFRRRHRVDGSNLCITVVKR